jgi:hypothetical protein
MNSKSFTSFEECITLMRSNDPMTFEEGYYLLLPKVKEFGDDIAKLIEGEEDSSVLSKLVELLGNCNDDKYYSVFVKALSSKHDDVVSWGLSGLEKLPSEDGKKKAQEFKSQNTKYS